MYDSYTFFIWQWHSYLHGICSYLVLFCFLLQPGFEDENSLDTPIVRYCAVSSIEHSHRAPISDLQWVPDHFEVNKYKS